MNSYQPTKALDFNLVLEGGAMRGMFTCGVTDFFIEKGLYPKDCIAVSAGALVGSRYIAQQIGESAYVSLKYIDDWRYLSFRSFLVTGNVCGRDFLFNQILNNLVPFDYEAFQNSPTKLTCVCTDLIKAKADYHQISSLKEELPYLIATSSLPLLSVPVSIDDKLLLDGGTADSIPVEYSLSTGMKKHVVVLTRDIEYRKKPDRLTVLEHKIYPEYPEFVSLQENRHEMYNKEVELVQQLEKRGEIFVLRPQKKVTVKQLENDKSKLLDLYEQGYEVACRSYKDLCSYLEIDPQ